MATTREFYLANLDLPETSTLSNSDLEYRFYQEGSGLSSGSLSDHKFAWLVSRAATSLHEYLSEQGYSGSLSDMLGQFFSSGTLVYLADKLTYGGDLYGAQPYGFPVPYPLGFGEADFGSEDFGAAA